MSFLQRILFLTAVPVIAAYISVQSADFCPLFEICFQLNIPDKTASLGTGDIYFQIRASTKYTWVALGHGKGMGGANIIVVYASAGRRNMTLSPRLAKGYSQPRYNSLAQVELLAGSGILDNGTVTANIKCSNCNLWDGGSATFDVPSGLWMYAAMAGDPLYTDDVFASIQKHTFGEVFEWSYGEAKGGSSENPFVDAALETTDSSANFTPLPTNSPSSSPSPSPSSTSTPASSPPSSPRLSTVAKAGIAVGVVVALALLGVGIWLYIVRSRRRAGAHPKLPELGPNEKSGLKRFLDGRWRAELHGSSQPVEIDGRAVNVMPGPPVELDANVGR